MACDDGDQVTGEFAVSKGKAVATSAGRSADELRAQLAVSALRQDVAEMGGYIPDVTPAQVMTQLADSMSRAVGRMDDVSLKIESTSEGTSFSFRAYRR